MRVSNKKVLRDYEVVEKIEAGVVLSGAEVKSVKMGQVNLAGGRVVIGGDEVWLTGVSIARYKYDGSEEEHDTTRKRKLLIKKEERLMLETKSRSGGLTLTPLSMYNKGKLIKVEIGLVRGKKKFEKREEIKKRKEKRALARRLKTKQ